MKQLIRFTGFFFLILSMYCCDPIDLHDPNKPRPGYLDQMPEETSIGANTFGCYINGELAAAQGVYQEKGARYLPELPYVNGFWDRYSGWINRDSIYTDMRLSFSSQYYYMFIRIPGDLSLGANDCSFFISCDTSELVGTFESLIDITVLDTKKQIISGRFDDMKVNFGDWTIRITKGQFDVNYGTNF